MPKQVHQQRNGRRTDPPDDFKSLHDAGLHCRRSRNRLSKGSERPAPWTRAASAVARTFGSLASRRFAQSRTRAGFLERLDSVWGSGDWDSATAWLRPAASIIARACFFRNDSRSPFAPNVANEPRPRALPFCRIWLIASLRGCQTFRPADISSPLRNNPAGARDFRHPISTPRVLANSAPSQPGNLLPVRPLSRRSTVVTNAGTRHGICQLTQERGSPWRLSSEGIRYSRTTS